MGFRLISQFELCLISILASSYHYGWSSIKYLWARRTIVPSDTFQLSWNRNASMQRAELFSFHQIKLSSYPLHLNPWVRFSNWNKMCFLKECFGYNVRYCFRANFCSSSFHPNEPDSVKSETYKKNFGIMQRKWKIMLHTCGESLRHKLEAEYLTRETVEPEFDFWVSPLPIFYIYLHFRWKVGSVGLWKLGGWGLDPLTSQHSASMHEKLTLEFHSTPTHYSRRLLLPRKWLLAPPGERKLPSFTLQ